MHLSDYLAVAAILISLGAAWFARSQAADTRRLREIETARRHEELTPKVEVRVEPLNPGDLKTFKLHIGLNGPPALRFISSLSVTIRDDKPHRAAQEVSYSGMRATAEQIAAQIWGPLRLTPRLFEGGGQVDDNGRSITMPNGLRVGESIQLQLEAVHPPPWTGFDADGASGWWRSTVGTTLRLTVDLVSETGEPWALPIEVDVPELVPITDTVL